MEGTSKINETKTESNAEKCRYRNIQKLGPLA